MPTSAAPEPGPIESHYPGGPLAVPLGRTLGGLSGTLAQPLYRAAINRINRRYDAGIGVSRLPVPVISVGNLSVGGTGKTPMVERIVHELRAQGRSPCVAMRGYAKHSRRGAESHARSDEEDVYHRLLPGVPVVAQPDRAAGVRALIESGNAIDTVVLDDGFQHRRLAREFDIVLIDASRDPFHDRLLPAGWLREPVASLRRANAIVVTHAELVSESAAAEIAGRVRGVVGAPSSACSNRHGDTERTSPHSESGATRIAVCRHVWKSLGVGEESRDLEWLRGRRAVVTCAIGNPGGFLAAANQSGASVVGSLVLPDHDPYTPRTIERLGAMIRRDRAEVLITTEKDWSKLRLIGGDWAGACPVARPELELRFDSGWDELIEAMMAAI